MNEETKIYHHVSWRVAEAMTPETAYWVWKTLWKVAEGFYNSHMDAIEYYQEQRLMRSQGRR